MTHTHTFFFLFFFFFVQPRVFDRSLTSSSLIISNAKDQQLFLKICSGFLPFFQPSTNSSTSLIVTFSLEKRFEYTRRPSRAVEGDTFRTRTRPGTLPPASSVLTVDARDGSRGKKSTTVKLSSSTPPSSTQDDFITTLECSGRNLGPLSSSVAVTKTLSTAASDPAWSKLPPEGGGGEYASDDECAKRHKAATHEEREAISIAVIGRAGSEPLSGNRQAY